MTDGKKRILIVDDELTTQVRVPALLKNLGGETELVVALSLQEGMEQLEAWAAQGHAADIVDMDLFPTGEWSALTGPRALLDIMDWATQKPEAVRPQKYFMHSVDTESAREQIDSWSELRGKVEIHDTEWKDIARGPTPASRFARRAHTSTLRQYLGMSADAPAEPAPAMPPAAAPQEKKFRWLIVDDDLATFIDTSTLLKNAPVNAQVVVVRNEMDAMTVLKLWAERGHAADIVDADMHTGGGMSFSLEPMGSNALRQIMAWADLQPAFAPRKYFIHSKDFLAARNAALGDPQFQGSVDPYHTFELWDVAFYGEGSPTNKGDTTVLRKYLNQTLGAGYPLSDAHVALLKEPSSKLGVYDACKLVEEGGIDGESALKSLDLDDVPKALTPCVDPFYGEDHPGYEKEPGFERFIGRVLTGRIVFSAEQAARIRAEGGKSILVLDSFLPRDTHLLAHTDGVILLAKETEHLALVVANHDITALMGENELHIRVEGGEKRLVQEPEQKEIGYQPWSVGEGDEVTLSHLSSTNGRLNKGAIPVVAPDNDRITMVDGWAKAAVATHGGLAVKANADTPEQVARAVELGADGIGLLRTEHMFFAPDRLRALQSAVLATSLDEQREALAALGAAQKGDLMDIFKVVASAGRPFPVTVRLLDAPPQEFFTPEQIEEMTRRYGEKNLRGVQLASQVNKLYATQAKAVFDAAAETGYNGGLDIMVPLVRTADEMQRARHEIINARLATGLNTGVKVEFGLRAMIETIGAAENWQALTKISDGLSFGTNDLTAELTGCARNDIAGTRRWMAQYNHVGKSPFLTFTTLARGAVSHIGRYARHEKPLIDLSCCGDQMAGDAASIEVCHDAGLDSISVPATPEHILFARIAAGRAAALHPRVRS